MTHALALADASEFTEQPLQIAVEGAPFPLVVHNALVDDPTVPEWLRALRLRANLTQEQVAARMGVRYPRVIIGWERGAHRPTLTSLLRFVRACGFRLELSLQPLPEETIPYGCGDCATHDPSVGPYAPTL